MAQGAQCAVIQNTLVHVLHQKVNQFNAVHRELLCVLKVSARLSIVVSIAEQPGPVNLFGGTHFGFGFGSLTMSTSKPNPNPSPQSHDPDLTVRNSDARVRNPDANHPKSKPPEAEIATPLKPK